MYVPLASCCPGSIATPTPQTFSVASPPAKVTGFGVDPVDDSNVITHCNPAQIHQVRTVTALTGLPPPVHSRYTIRPR
jgi:hypothetical protein